MKRILTILLSAVMLTGVIGLSSCGEEKAKPKKEKMVEVVHKAIPDGSYVATGSFNGKYPITMKFTVKGQKLAGQYYYNKYGPGAALDIVGRVDTTFVAIQEFDPNGINSGDFQGNTVTADEISGIFNTHANGKMLPFTFNYQEANGQPDYFNMVYYVNGYNFGPELPTTKMAKAKAEKLGYGYYIVEGSETTVTADADNADVEEDDEAYAEDEEAEEVEATPVKHKSHSVTAEDIENAEEIMGTDIAESIQVPLWVWIVMIVLFAFGFLGCFINKVPGPLLAFIAILIFHFIAIKLPIWALIVCAILVIASMIVNYKVLPKFAKKVHEYGKAGTWGTTIGSLIAVFPLLFSDKWWIGLIIFLIFPFALAYLFELISRKDFKDALLRATGAFSVFLASSMLKFVVFAFSLYLVINAKEHQVKSDVQDMQDQATEMVETMSADDYEYE